MRKLAAASLLVIGFIGCAVSRAPTEQGNVTPPPSARSASTQAMIAAYDAALGRGYTADFTTSRIVGDANSPDYRVQAYLKSLQPRPQITCNDTQSFNVVTGGPLHTTPATFSAWTSCATTDIVALAIDSTASSGRGIAGTNVSPTDASAADSGLVVLTNLHTGGAPQLQSFAPTSLLPTSQSFNLGGIIMNLAGTRLYALSQQGNLYCFNIPATTTPATAMTACGASWPYSTSGGQTITYSTAFPTYGAAGEIQSIYFGDDNDTIYCAQGMAGTTPGTQCWAPAGLIAGGDANEKVGPVVAVSDPTSGKETLYLGDNGGRFFRITDNGSSPTTGGTIERSDLCTFIGQSSPCASTPWGVHGSPTIDFTSSNAYVTAAGYLFQFDLFKEQGSWGGSAATYKNLNTLHATSTNVDGSTVLDHTHGYAYVGFNGYIYKAAFPFDGNPNDKIFATQLTQTVTGAGNYPVGYPLLYAPYNSIYMATGTNAASPASGIVEQYALNGNGAAPPLAGITAGSSSPPPFGSMIESGIVLDWANGNLYFGYDVGPGTSGGIGQYPAAAADPSTAWGCPTSPTIEHLSGGVCVSGCTIPSDCTLGANVLTEACTAGVCSVATCVANYRDCDNLNTNGCEVDIQTNPDNCGACQSAGGTVCPAVNDTPACVNGSCSITCNSGYGICAPGNVNTSGCPTAISCTSCCGTGPGGSNTCGGGTACVGGSCAATTQHVCGEENEDSSGTNPVTVTCPGGETIQAISFVSYGTPNGSCGSWSKGSCDDSSGSTGNNNEGLIASNACYGQTTCSIDPTNGNFGDPCGGTYKRLALQVECACGPVLSLCGNGYQDGDETDVDCGGGAETGCTNAGNIPSPCAQGKKCSVNGDCQSGICTSGTCSASTPPTPIAYYPLTEQTGTTTANFEGASDTGALHSTTWAGAGEGVTFAGTAASYIQASGFTSLATSSASAESFTLALWANPTATAGVLIDVSNSAAGSGWCTPFLGFNSSGQVVAQVWTGADAAAVSPSALATGVWSHIAMTYSGGTSGGTLDLYINGSLVASQTAAYTPSGSGSPADYLSWGSDLGQTACAHGTITQGGYQGGMDMMYVYNAALTASQVATLALTAPSGACTTNVICAANVATGSSATVTCPNGGLIEAVEFVSFGTPSGTCGSFSKGSCDDSGNSSGNNEEREIASTDCYGLNTCTIPVNTTTFGDPCTGTTKTLDLQVECGCAPIANECANGWLDGAETDIDCGGGTCGRCVTGKKCLVNSDCTSNDCSSGICTTFPTAVASYSLSEQSGTSTADGTGNVHTGTLNDEGSTGSNLEWAGTGAGITFPGAQGAYLQASGFTSLGTSDTAFSLALWVKPTVAAGILVNVTNTASGTVSWCTPFLGFNASGEVVAQLWEGADVGAHSPSALPTGTWSHIAMTYSGSAGTPDGVKLYINGVLVASNAGATTYAASTDVDYIDWGSNQGPNTCALGTITSGAYSGGMDLMYVYGGELTAAQVSSLASEAPAGVCTPSIACATNIGDGNTATVACPLGSAIQAVEFVSYGTPTGTCGTFAYGACDDSNGSSGNNEERAIASAACYGLSSCSIPVNTTAFGDPCSSSSRYLDIQVECGCAPLATQCANGYEDGSETDVDCGGGTCTRCGTSKKCLQNSDCLSNSCSAGTCGAFPSAVASYSLSEQSGTSTADATGNGHTGTLNDEGITSSNLEWAGAGDGITFPGAQAAYLQAGGFTSLGTSNTAFSLALWVKPTVAAGILVNVTASTTGTGGWCTPFLGFNTSGQVVAQLWEGSDVGTHSTSALPTGAWSHIAMTYSGSAGTPDGVKLYINGVLIGSNAAATTYSANGAADFIDWGSNQGPNGCALGTITSGAYSGGMDLMYVYGSELTAANVAALAAEAPTGAACTTGSQCYSGVCVGGTTCQ